MIAVMNVQSLDGQPCVGVILSNDAVFLTAEGTPCSGVALTPERARAIAAEMLIAATRVETA